MSNIFEDNGLVLYWDDFINTFDILKQLYDEHGNLYMLISISGDDDKNCLMEWVKFLYEYLNETHDEICMMYSLKEPKFDILGIYKYGYDGNFALMGNIDENFLWIIAQLLYSNNEYILIFSNEPEDDWLHDYIEAMSKYEFSLVTLYYWQTIVQHFHFSFFNTLPDWDCDSNTLLISKDQKLFNKFMYNKNRKYSWKKLKMNMFPMDDLC